MSNILAHCKYLMFTKRNVNENFVGSWNNRKFVGNLLLLVLRQYDGGKSYYILISYIYAHK